MKLTALEELNARLLSSGMDQDDVDHLLARFLEEEAYDYVDCMDVMKDMLLQKEKGNSLSSNRRKKRHKYKSNYQSIETTLYTVSCFYNAQNRQLFLNTTNMPKRSMPFTKIVYIHKFSKLIILSVYVQRKPVNNKAPYRSRGFTV